MEFVRNPISMDRVIFWEANVKHEAEPTSCCNNADVSDINYTTAVLNW